MSSDRTFIKRAERVAAACIGCVAAKVKCQDNKPCARCVKKNISCEPISSQNYTSRTPVSQQGTSIERSLNDGTAQSVDSQSRQNNFHLSNASITEDVEIPGNQDSSQNLLFDSIDTAAFNPIQLIPDNETSYFTPQPYSNFPLLSGDPNYGLPFVSGNFSQFQDVNFSLWDVDFDSVELGYQGHNDDIATEFTESNHDSGNTRASRAARRQAAFERSPWLFKPTSHDHALNDQASLNLDEENISTVLTPSNDQVGLAAFSKCCIDSKIRDQLLSIVFSMRRGSSKVPSFPSLELLNSIVQVFFIQESYRHHSLLHFGTFNPRETLPELFMAIIAAGSTSISIPAVWKMGIALQDIGRHALAEFVSPIRRTSTVMTDVVV